MLILGIDPGSHRTGYGILQIQGNHHHYITSGCIQAKGDNTFSRLQSIFNTLKEIITLHQPQEAAIEQIFLHQNPNTALKLGQARGAAIAALTNIPLAEYAARAIKQSVVGFGAAKKEQVQHMVKCLLGLTSTLQADEADALAIALCHAQMRFWVEKTGCEVKNKKKRGGWRAYKPIEAS